MSVLLELMRVRLEKWRAYEPEDDWWDYQHQYRDAADTIEELLGVLQLWIDYDNQDEAEFANIGPILLYENAMDATRAAMAKATP